MIIRTLRTHLLLRKVGCYNGRITYILIKNFSREILLRAYLLLKILIIKNYWGQEIRSNRV